MRTMLVAAVVAAGVGAVVLTPAAEAGPTVSPFVGTYTGPALEPFDEYSVVWASISISTSGKISGTKPDVWIGTGKFAGSVAADGAYSLSGSFQWTWPHAKNWVRNVIPGGAEIGAAGATDAAVATTSYFQSGGTLVLGADGNLHGTTTSGATFVWTRK